MSDPTPEPDDLEERIYQGLRRACDGDLRRMARLLASKPYEQLLGRRVPRVVLNPCAASRVPGTG